MGLLKKGNPAVLKFTTTQIDNRLSETVDPSRKDFLSRFLAQQKTDPTGFTVDEVQRGCLSNVTAGSDTTAISLLSIFYHLMKYPHTMTRLRQEIDDAIKVGKISEPISYKESLQLPYFQAVMKEALRVHGATGFPLERLVGPDGVVILDTYFPPGTVVGVNSWVMHYDKDIFGDDAYEFRPERWLDIGSESYKHLDRSFFAFGSGSRTCIGKNVSIMEMSKLVPQLLRKFDFELADKDEEWKLRCAWFVNQHNVKCRVSKRLRSS